MINDNLEVRVTDLANAKKIENITSSIEPTSGGSYVQDPTILGKINNDEERKYTVQSEMYAIGVNMYAAITSKRPFRYKKGEEMIAEDMDGNIMLNEGQLNRKQHNESLEKALSELPSWARDGWISSGYENIIRKCLTADENERYESFEDLKRDFEKLSKPPIWPRFVKPVISSLILCGMITYVTVEKFQEGIEYGVNRATQEIARLQEQNRKGLIPIKLLPKKNNENEVIVPVYFEDNETESEDNSSVSTYTPKRAVEPAKEESMHYIPKPKSQTTIEEPNEELNDQDRMIKYLEDSVGDDALYRESKTQGVRKDSDRSFGWGVHLEPNPASYESNPWLDKRDFIPDD